MFNKAIKVLLLVTTFLAASAFGNSWSQLFEPNMVVRLNPETRILWEPENSPLTLPDVITRKDEFDWPSSSNPNYGLSQRGIWFLNRFTNVSEVNKWIIDIGFAQNQQVDFYLLANDRIIAQSKQGKERLNQMYRFPTFAVDLPFARPLELFIRVGNSQQPIVVPIDIQSVQAHTQATNLDNVMWGIFYGGLLMLFIYNLVLFAGTREPSLIAYIIYLPSVVFWQFVWGGHAQLLLNGEIANWVNQHTDVLFLLVALSAGYFTVTFLNTRVTAPNLHRILVPVLAFVAVLVPVVITDVLSGVVVSVAVYVSSMVAILCFLASGFESYLNRFKPARYFVVAWTVLSIGAFIGLLGLMGMLPSNSFTTYCFQVGVFLEAALFSIALIDKTRHQLELEVNEATDDLVNNMELIEEQNVRLELARKDAVKASKIKSQFLANMSHEIRTPLNAILGFSQELAKIKLPKIQREHVQIINTSASNLLAIVNDVLDFSKIEAGKLQINEEPFDMNGLLEELVFINARAAQKKQVVFVYEPTPLPRKMMGDAARIKQVLTNLLSNAVKFTPSGYVYLRINAVKPDEERVLLTISVEDTGIGISRYDQQKLFTAFSQIDDQLTRSFQGTGLGLVICQQLMSLMRGKISFSSDAGTGSQFTVEFTCYRLSHLDDLAPLPAWQGKRVALFDPDPETRRANGKLLTGVGVQLTSIDSLGFLQEQYDQFDYLMVNFHGIRKIDSEQLCRAIKLFPAGTKVLLHDDYQVMDEEKLQSLFQRKLENPLLLSNLVSFHDQKQEPDTDIFHHRLNELPALRILAVDDMEINLRLLKTWLQDSPVNLELCYSGQEAVSLCQTHEYDLILMDVQMPEMDGLEATRRIRRIQLNQGTPIIAVTAHAFREEQERLLNSGMDDYLPKPLDLASMINMIRLWCSVPDNRLDNVSDTDWELAKKRANQDEQLAVEMFSAFQEELPQFKQNITLAAQHQDWSSLQSHVHKLHGASC
ncbi:MAG: 7TM diverse intracellular signaling domain-containing protein [Aestuariibacter sp.]